MKQKLFRIILIFICLSSCILLACADSDNAVSTGEPGDRAPENEIQSTLPENDDKVTIAQGVWGNVWFWEGDHMPSTDPEGSSGTITPVEREILIYETATENDVTAAADSSFYSEIRTALVATTDSDTDGFYQAVLPPGSYSVFIKENGLFYADSFGGSGEIGPLTVKPNQVQKHQIDITYQATF